jgi:hypothetical protein
MDLPANGVVFVTGIRIVETPSGETTSGSTATKTEQEATHMLMDILASLRGHPLQSSGIDPVTVEDIIEAASATMPEAAAYRAPAAETRLSDKITTSSRRKGWRMSATYQRVRAQTSPPAEKSAFGPAIEAAFTRM